MEDILNDPGGWTGLSSRAKRQLFGEAEAKARKEWDKTGKKQAEYARQVVEQKRLQQKSILAQAFQTSAWFTTFGQEPVQSISPEEGDSGEDMDVARIWYDEGVGRLKLRTPWVNGTTTKFVEELKADSRIPIKDRRWNRDLKLWEIEPEHLDVLLEIVARYFEVQESLRPTIEDSSRILLDALPPEALDLVKKQLAKVYHPDKGGDEDTMKTINSAFAQYKESRRED
jgi:hypothetical protein